MKISLIKSSWCCCFHFISADYILGGNADLSSILSIMSPTAALSRDSAQLFELETVGKMQGKGTIRWADSWKLQLPEQVCFSRRRRERSRVVETCLNNYHQTSIFVNEILRGITNCLDYLRVEETETALFIWALLGQATCRTGTALNVVA